jgi:hypothetical protein
MLNTFKLLILAVFLLMASFSFSQTSPASTSAIITRHGEDMVMPLYIEQQFKLDEFTIRMTNDSILLDSITISFPPNPSNLILSPISIVILEGDSLKNIFAAWMCDDGIMPGEYLTSNGFSCYLANGKVKKFAIVIKCSPFMRAQLSPTISLSGSTGTRRRTMPLDCHTVTYR